MNGNSITSKNELLILAKVVFADAMFGVKDTPLGVVNSRIRTIFRRGPYKTIKEIEEFISSYASIYDADIYCPQGINRITGWGGKSFTCKNGMIISTNNYGIQHHYYNEDEGEDVDLNNDFEEEEDEDDPDF